MSCNSLEKFTIVVFCKERLAQAPGRSHAVGMADYPSPCAYFPVAPMDALLRLSVKPRFLNRLETLPVESTNAYTDEARLQVGFPATKALDDNWMVRRNPK